MNINPNKTIIRSLNKDTQWYIINAKNYKLGRLSSTIANVLKSKNSNNYLPYQEGGTRVVVINAENIQLTGNKKIQKTYKKHSGRPGKLKVETFEKLKNRIPTRVIEHAVKGMLPKNAMGRKLFTNLKVYKTTDHPYTNKQLIEIKTT